MKSRVFWGVLALIILVALIGQDTGMKSRVFWGVLALIILVALIGQVVDPEVPHYRWEAIPGFYAGFGFVACILLILLAKGLAKVIEKPEDYYHGG